MNQFILFLQTFYFSDMCYSEIARLHKEKIFNMTKLAPLYCTFVINSYREERRHFAITEVLEEVSVDTGVPYGTIRKFYYSSLKR